LGWGSVIVVIAIVARVPLDPARQRRLRDPHHSTESEDREEAGRGHLVSQRLTDPEEAGGLRDRERESLFAGHNLILEAFAGTRKDIARR
jgi:hypothetical protein